MKKSTLRVGGTRVGCALLILAASAAAPLFVLSVLLLSNIYLLLCALLILVALVVFGSSVYLEPRDNVSPFGCVILLLAAFATSVSLAYLQPPDCPLGLASNICKLGVQTAGFPFPILHDGLSASSPTSSWGRMDFSIEDIATFNVLAFYADVAFYVVLLWFPLRASRLALRLGRFGVKSTNELKPH